MSFQSLGLSAPLLRALSELGYNTPTPVQVAAIPEILNGRDVLAGAQTGTGKTAAFALPILHHLSRPNTAIAGRPIRALIITPTRELTSQVQASVHEYAAHLEIRSTTVFGGVSQRPQVEALRRGVDILVATPGRLMDLVGQRQIDLSRVEVLVLDEADRMLDMGFLPEIRRILSGLPKQRQTLLFSATFAEPIKQLAAQFMRSPVEIQIAARNSVVATIEHIVHPVDAARKRDLLLHVLAEDSRRQTLVFSRTKHGADKLVKILWQFGHKAAVIHGNKSQNARDRALTDFKSGKVNTLIATDVAARGLDIDQLPTVINYDLPMVAEDYVHRIGRTGRNGALGKAISLVCADESAQLRDIQKLLGRDISKVEIAGFIPTQPLKMTAGSPRRAPRPAPVDKLKRQGRIHKENRSAGNGPRREGGRNNSTRPQGSRAAVQR